MQHKPHKPHRKCVSCRERQRVYAKRYREKQRLYTDPPRITTRDKVLAWLKAAPRTSAQVAELLGMTTDQITKIMLPLRRAGLVVPVGEMRPGATNTRYQAV